MIKELLSIEFRYYDKPAFDDGCVNRNKTITIGIFDTLEEAIAEGNKVLSVLSKNFQVRESDKFILNHLFGHPKRLVTNACYPTKGIQYFAQIKQLNFGDLDEVVDETFRAYEEYKKYMDF